MGKARRKKVGEKTSPIFQEEQLRGGDGNNTLHQARLAAGGGVLVDNTALPRFVNNRDGFCDAGRDFFGLGGAGGNQVAALLDKSLDLRLGRLVPKLPQARALDVFDDGFDIGHGVE